MTQAILALSDGSVFHGTSIGVSGETIGEVVFNTAMTGYQEILTDPSYSQQIVTLTYPHIGNVGCNRNDEESDKVHAAGLVIRDLPLTYSNWRSECSLQDYLKQHKTIAIADIDTRRLTRILRDKGALAGCIVAGENISDAVAVNKAKNFAGLKGMDLAQQVTTDSQYEWTEGTWQLTDNDHPIITNFKYKIVAYDFGVKKNILRILADEGCHITVVPAKTPAEKVLALQPDGVFLSSGPGDPEPCDYAITAIQRIKQANIPMFGICLGHQLLAIASGARTIKMKFGHHGANHPVKDLTTEEVMITSQNHGFAVEADSLPRNVRATHVSLFDGSLQGIELTDKPAFGFQGHPEASPGPHDLKPLFKRFIKMMSDANDSTTRRQGEVC